IVRLTDIMEAVPRELPGAAHGPGFTPSVAGLEPGRDEGDASQTPDETNRHPPPPLPPTPLYTTLAAPSLPEPHPMPEQDEVLTVDGWQLRILEIEHVRIARVELIRLDEGHHHE